MHLTQQTLVLAALGLGYAIAQPAGSLHRHLHKHKKDVDWKDASNYKDVNWATVNYGDASSSAAAPAVAASSASVSPIIVTSEAANPVTTSAAASLPSAASSSAVSSSAASSSAASPSSAPSSSSPSNPNSGSVLFHPAGCPSTGFGGRTKPIASSNVDTYVGNIGSPYGCNMQLVASASGYDYSNTFTNSGSAALTIILWNKSGSGGAGANAGQSSTPNLGFTLAPGASQVVAFDENSQVGWSRNCDRRADDNAPDCTWGEGDFGNLSNGGWSGYDVSSIQNSKGNAEPMCITSSERNGGKESSNRVNNFVSDHQADMGAGGQVPPEAKPVQLLTVFG